MPVRRMGLSLRENCNLVFGFLALLVLEFLSSSRYYNKESRFMNSRLRSGITEIFKRSRNHQSFAEQVLQKGVKRFLRYSVSFSLFLNFWFEI